MKNITYKTPKLDPDGYAPTIQEGIEIALAGVLTVTKFDVGKDGNGNTKTYLEGISLNGATATLRDRDKAVRHFRFLEDEVIRLLDANTALADEVGQLEADLAASETARANDSLLL